MGCRCSYSGGGGSTCPVRRPRQQCRHCRAGKRIDEPDVDSAALDRQWSINTLGVVANIRAVAKVIPDGGRIISIGSKLGAPGSVCGNGRLRRQHGAVIGYSKERRSRPRLAQHHR
jgi:NAD(P)-dependent dehydrogenase (short-subunit alcohol dehydrogenase family)